MWTDWYFKDVYDLEMVEGRWFEEANPTDSSALILNESAVKAFGFEDPLEQAALYPVW